MIKITKINIQLKFKEYQFSRVKATSSVSAIAYTNTAWVDKDVIAIPMKLTVTDRFIEHSWNETNQQYELNVESDVIFRKTVKQGANIGRIHLPNKLIGLDVLIIETPIIEDLY